MAYSTDILDTRVKVLNRGTSSTGDYGKKAGTYAEACSIWCNWKWTKGVQAMREGALDAYDTVLVRCRYNASITRDSRLEKDGKDYQITSLQEDKRANEMQMVIVEIIK